jgi:hypothetical protein
MQNYQNLAFVTPIVRQIDVPINKQQIQRLYLGSIYPLVSTDNAFYQLAIPSMGNKQHAELKIVSIPKTMLQPWPLKSTPYQFTLLLNQLLGMPYGWGDLDFNSDCSGILRRFFTAFAIWLPRNSYSQAHYGSKFYSLADMPIEQRKQVLVAGSETIPTPIPYLTLFNFGSKASTTGQTGSIGHIALYIGSKNHEAFIMQSAWGLKIYKGKEPIGRAIIGKAAITPITAGAEVHLPLGLKLRTLLESPALGITFLN